MSGNSKIVMNKIPKNPAKNHTRLSMRMSAGNGCGS